MGLQFDQPTEYGTTVPEMVKTRVVVGKFCAEHFMVVDLSDEANENLRVIIRDEIRKALSKKTVA